MQCPNCFAQLPEGSVACGYCGTQLNNQMPYTPDMSNQQGYYNQAPSQDYPNFPGGDNMNMYNQPGQDYNQNMQYNQYDQGMQSQDYNQYPNMASPGYNQYDNQANTPAYDQGMTPQAAYGYDNTYNQQAAPYQTAATIPNSGNSGGGKTGGGKNKILIISVVAVAAIALIIGLVLILGGGKDKDKDSKKTTEEPTTTEATTEATTTEATTTEATTTEEPTTEATTTEEPTTEATTESVASTLSGYNGKYVLSHFDQDGVTATVEEVAEYSDTSLEMSLVIYNNTCLLDATGMDNGGKYYCDITIEDGAVTLDDGYEVIEGTYDEEKQQISMLYNGTNMIYTLDPGDGTTYDMVGDYVLSYGIADGTEYSLEELREMMGDPEFDMTLKVYGILCTLTSFEDGTISVASTTMEAVGTDLYFQDGDGALMGTYDPDNQTISIFTGGVDLIFELGTRE